MEEFEDIVFNLSNDVDVQSTYSRLESFKIENRDILERNLARLANEHRQALIEEDFEREKRDKARIEAENEKEKEMMEMIQVKQKFINDLVRLKLEVLIQKYLLVYCSLGKFKCTSCCNIS